VIPSRRIEAGDAVRLVDDLQSPADMEGRGRDHLSLVDDRELRRAPADVEIEDAAAGVMGCLGGTRAVGGEHRLHVVPGRRADELAAMLRDDARDGLSVLAPQGLAREDHDAGVDLVGVDAGGLVRIVDDVAEAALVDALLALIRRQGDGRLEQGLARNDVIPARKLFTQAPEVQAREDHLRARRAHVDADALQRDVILDPDRIFFDRAIDLEMVVVVIVVAALLMRVLEIGPVDVVLEGVSALRLGIVGHQSLRGSSVRLRAGRTWTCRRTECRS
jgi:hypothetical protein